VSKGPLYTHMTIGITPATVAYEGNLGLLKRWLIRTGRMKVLDDLYHVRAEHDGWCAFLKSYIVPCDCEPNCVDLADHRVWTWDHYQADPRREDHPRHRDENP